VDNPRLSFSYWARLGLARVWPSRWCGPFYMGRVREASGLYAVCVAPTLVEVVAPAPLHLVLRLALWPFYLLDWAPRAVIGLPFQMLGMWRLPNFGYPWPPLP
jgi:hypothetical protein